ncbi:MAG: sensor histidine kinase [Aristaeellaceae bacterium]
MKGSRCGKRCFFLLFAAAILLVIVGVGMLAQVFTHYNELSMARQDSQLQSMAKAADRSIANLLDNLRTDLSYVLSRRGFAQAEAEWAQDGETDDLRYRMEENLISRNSYIHAMLAIREEELLLSTDGCTDYTFPASRRGSLQPCFAGDGTMYLALIEETSRLKYAALIDLSEWYEELAGLINTDGIRLMLLDSDDKLLLHAWADGTHVTGVEALTESSCDVQAVRFMMESRNAGRSMTVSYTLTDPCSGDVHDMRMAVIPTNESANGYFIVGITGDYDEIITPMQRAAIQLIIFGGMMVLGVLLTVVLTLHIIRRNRQTDRELQRLVKKNEETQKLLEKTQTLAHHQRLETIGTMASSIAHEINNLLTPIMGYAILTLEGLPEGCDELADNVTEIYEASRKAKTIISRLNDLARKNAGETFHPVSLPALAQKTLDVAAPARPDHVTVSLDCTDPDLLVEGNETQLSQLLLNLILNAFHAMEETGGTLALSMAREKNEAVLRVADTGIGIPPEVLPHIFEPFFTTRESGKGTGLGLAIVHQIVESHHGVIAVDSTPGQGAAFTLWFPLAGAGSGDQLR